MMTEAFTTIQFSAPVKRPESPKLKRIQKSNSSVNIINVNSKGEPIKRGGSFVVGQKLRESKWFQHNELSVVCAVIETGFIIELKKSENEIQYGIAIWKQGFEKSKDPNYLTIYTLEELKGKLKPVGLPLLVFWLEGKQLRIANKSDRTQTPLPELKIRNQITNAENSKKKWQNTEHFTYYCRYGPAIDERTRSITNGFKWNPESFFLKLKNFTIK